ncbi:Gfo/Idh/MocA family oxidoreductase [Prochlorococcus sp. MIT 1307]|uniref:Gfo/Idh/MocA family protein n=1 Tax=Prochlorococcus sp. MIT 1307 TaxID=3096219 RepID=UPI002A765AD7|nr:Gfo/Idh/MocA family oxidoreductase [Prochlorococcus sp. MIT 1307]
MKKQYNVLIIGLGKIGCLYDINSSDDNFIVTHAKAFDLHSNFKLIGGVDLSHENCLLFKNKYKVKTFNKIEDAIQVSDPDVLVISTNTDSHNSILRKIIELSLNNKTILCEKPISNNAYETLHILKDLASLNNRLYVNYMRRADPGVLEIKERLETGKIKTPIKGVCYYTNGIYNNASHFIDMLTYWLGEEKKAFIINQNFNHRATDPEPDFHIEFKKGSLIFLSLKSLKYSVLTAEIYSPSGRIFYQNEGRQITFQGKIPCPNFNGYSIIEPDGETIDNKMNISQLNVVNQLFRALQFKENHLCTGIEAIHTLELINKLLKVSKDE